MSEDLFKVAFLEAKEEAVAEYKEEISEMGIALEKFIWRKRNYERVKSR